MSVVRARRARDGRCFVTDGWRLGCSGACASDNRETPTTSPASVCATLATDGLACNGRGTCVDAPGDYPNFVCLCDDGYLGARCEAAVVALPNNASFVRYVDAPLRAGQYEVFRFDVRCSPMDVEITFKKAANDTNVDTEVQFLLHRSKMAYAGQLGLYTNESISRGLFPGEDTLNLDVNDIETGMWYLQLIVISGELGSGFELGYELFGSRLARYNEFNDCERDDGALLFTVNSTNGSYTITQPFVFEPDYRDCGDEEQSCYIGDAHSSIRGQGRGAARNGVGPILGRKPVLAMSTPEPLLDTPYFLLVGDSRKFLGVYNASDPWFSTDGVKSATLTSLPPRLLAQMMPNATALPFDHEACGSILNRADMIGNVCVVSRGSCVFSMKTLQCQASGAVAAIIIDDQIDSPFAPDNWVNTHLPDKIKIPTLAYNLVDGNRLLVEMFDDPNVTVDIRTYQCTPKVHCARCAPGLTSPETNCTSMKCPGMDESFDESHHYRRANRETTITVLAIVLSFFGIAVCATAYQIRRRRQRMTAHIIWKPADSDDEQPPPTVDSRV